MRGAGINRFTPQVHMMGGGLKRYHPDRPAPPQRGKGINRFVHGVVGDSITNFARGYHKSKQPDTVAAIQSGFKSVKKGVKRSLKTQTQKSVAKKARKTLGDIFGR